ncbi:MAG: hypothetical protein A3F72_02940 [Bacteroidetes bacterium RIFCSPLOWO2_12_FULL_35_15]|nr:MAG: hypothetical protein A3F72_02940 [Bacteroidetes bacterium RIFCSPLOWO2_12_FULL_35_15]
MENKEVLFSEDYRFSYMPGVSASISTDVINTTRPSSSINKLAAKNEILFWGEDNDFPQLVIADVRKNTELGMLLEKQAGLLYAGGLIWGTPDPEDDSKLVPVDKANNVEIKAWLKHSNINRYLQESATDVYWFYNVFPEIVLNIGGTEILQICSQAAEECRWGVQNSKSGMIDNCYINAQWPDGKANDPFTKKLPVLDAYYNPAQQLKENLKGTNYIYPLNYAQPGNKFYQLASWNSLRESGWLAVAEAIPKFKKALLANQMTIKYHIRISNMYWEKKFDGWAKMPDKDKTNIKKKEIESMQDTLMGAEKAGRSLISVVHHEFNGGNGGKEFNLIQIEAIDDKIKDGKYLEDGKDASLRTMSAIGLHPALVGTMPNNGMGGAGSNIREAYNLHVMTNKSRQDLILEPLNNLIIEFNGWDPEIEFRFRNQFMTTLDKGSETKKIA